MNLSRDQHVALAQVFQSVEERDGSVNGSKAYIVHETNAVLRERNLPTLRRACYCILSRLISRHGVFFKTLA